MRFKTIYVTGNGGYKMKDFWYKPDENGKDIEIKILSEFNDRNCYPYTIEPEKHTKKSYNVYKVLYDTTKNNKLVDLTVIVYGNIDYPEYTGTNLLMTERAIQETKDRIQRFLNSQK